MVGGPYFAKNLAALKTGGRIVYIAAQGGGTIELPIGALMQKRGFITGSTLRPRAADEKARLAGEVERVVWPWIEAGIGEAGDRPHLPARRGRQGAGAAGERPSPRQGGADGELTRVADLRISDARPPRTWPPMFAMRPFR